MSLLVILLGLYAFMVVSWLLYLAVMNLARHRDQLHPFAKANAYLILGVALPVDMLLNAVVGTILFLDPPRELMMTSRLKRYHRTAAGTWRDKVATWMCTHLLNQFDPKGGHC